ncbi:Uu.00g066380.m01.CDS01 [Anthostomella pinea]|uniref:Uu.00g066380.m01.CDS01 n=1 Tax=Anthostomella pinea TaxID=933095 RepID=A0AAI8YN91_9PEZI|nr:Uu.00g066380.m01.CDS01 [Anthostomella pinea]
MDERAAGEVLLPGDAGYDDSLERWGNTCAAVVRPTTAPETSAVVRFVTANSVPLAVRGGSHNPSRESAAQTNTVVLDLANMRSVVVDTAAQTVTYGGGCTWADVNNEAWKHGLATVGGTVSHTGSPARSCSQAGVVKASESETEDLFWALRGAGPSFGIVTSFASKVFPQGKVWGGLLMWPFDDVFDKWFMPMLLADPATGMRLRGANVFYIGTAEEAEEFYAPLLALAPSAMDTTARIPYSAANTATDAISTPGRWYMSGGANFSCPLDRELTREAAEEYYAGLDKPGNAEIRTSAFALELIPQQKVTELGKLGKKSFAGRDGKYNVVMLMSWDAEERDAEVKKIVTKLTSAFKAKYGTKDTETGGADAYYNYLSPDIPADRALMKTWRLFGANAPRLRALKVIYDPTNVFRKNVNLMSSAK